MSALAVAGAVEAGLLFSLVALGVYLSFRVLNFPDLTVDGSFPLGAAATAVAIIHGVNPFLATVIGTFAGCCAGFVSAFLNVRFRILNLLAGILTMVALYSINLRVMGRPNISLYGENTIFTAFEGVIDLGIWTTSAILLVFAIAMKLLVDWFLGTQVGLALRASGENPAMARAQSVSNGRMTIIGMSVSNALVGLAGSLFAQSQGVADVSLGIGTIVTGLAALIIGETLLGSTKVFWATLGCLIGALLYRLFIAAALSAGFLGIQAQDLNLVTAVVVAIAVILSQARRNSRFKFWPKMRSLLMDTQPQKG
ncbi:MAG: ABC transporter permease [Roseitalea sp.]|uniref:ABC transporter permease n=1 Tax=Oceaniradius stylonematis TaxID=2184161 RepID=UPI000F3CB4D4|nr:ABC transporter permease [Oceaniradius stylonematis]MBO6552014.1 ABC transporter permease [Roseitalea sp.]MBO6951606.1 ABC transporter permease [Rhizobiaceae bacterium]RNC95934.1 MAG: ABC transporter permease [Oricola sp.]MBO6592548.1 ABC transporter permease [Roseitalea sp.]MBO6598803.1 ABC transporter permease [Roseitalea sp.]